MTGERQQNLEHPAAVDFFRVLAAFCVGWFHIWQQSWVGGGWLDHWPRSGAVWVDVLVLLSAFCLFLPTANALASGAAPLLQAPAAFWRRRAVRILPSYYASLLVSLALAVTAPGGRQGLLLDLAAHLTLTQMFFPAAYTATALNSVTWTLTVFALFYLVFPWLQRAMLRKPAPVLAALLAIQLGWTLWLLPQYGTTRYPLLFNQFPAFCGVLAVGLAGALAFARLGRLETVQRPAVRVFFTTAGLALLVVLDEMMRRQAAAPYQLFQLQNRMPLALAACGCMVFLALGVPFPLGRMWRFLAGFSYNFYLWHQLAAVTVKYRLRLPAWAGNTPPNQLGDREWMLRYNALAWAASLLAAVAATCLIERPAARRL
ncbi:MAG: acyltransferase family protein, partial [Gemmiger sp.]